MPEENGKMLIILQEGSGEEFVEENLDKNLHKFINFYSFEEIKQILNKFEVITKKRKKSNDYFSMKNDKSIVICKKI